MNRVRTEIRTSLVDELYCDRSPAKFPDHGTTRPTIVIDIWSIEFEPWHNSSQQARRKDFRPVVCNLRLLDFVPIRDEELPNYKLHLAIGPKDRKEPLYELANSGFKSWQEHQSKRNSEREYILALIYYNRYHHCVEDNRYSDPP